MLARGFLFLVTVAAAMYVVGFSSRVIAYQHPRSAVANAVVFGLGGV